MAGLISCIRGDKRQESKGYSFAYYWQPDFSTEYILQEVWKEVTKVLRHEKLEWKCGNNSKDQEEPSPITG
jgi:hypothetical protein